MQMTTQESARHVMRCLELAILLEAGAHKPGNVSVLANFEKTRYEHFLASAVAAASSFESGARRGIAAHKGKMKIADVGVGNIIKNCVADIEAWQHGGNTLLGTVILLSPMAVAAGMTLAEGSFNVGSFRKNLKLVVESTTPVDAVNLYAAIEIAKPSGLGKTPDLDLNDPTSAKSVSKEYLDKLFEIKMEKRIDRRSRCSFWEAQEKRWDY